MVRCLGQRVGYKVVPQIKKLADGCFTVTDSSSRIFYAHSTERPDRGDWQLLTDHLADVGQLAAHHARYFGGEDCARIAGQLHDVGKYTREFQNRLEGALDKVDHATRGAVIANERYGSLGRLLAYGIAGHHVGLANGFQGGSRKSLKERLKKELPALDPIWETEVSLKSNPTPPPFSVAEKMPFFQYSFFGRMLFSCLVDADYLDTEAFYAQADPRIAKLRGGYPDLEDLKGRLDQYLEQFKSDTPVNKVRSDILEHVRGATSEPTGMFSLNVPTGGGKTLSSLAFALDHAIHHGLRRVIFVIPFTSIVEQNATVFRRALGDTDSSIVLEHHSAFVDSTDQAPQAREKLRAAMENWDAPVIVTTAVQFFESLFADRPSRCRKLHNITGSVVILDEAQTLPLKLLRPCVAVMGELARNYSTSVVLCTATQPALSQEDGFKDGLVGVRELAPYPELLHQKLERVSVRHVGALTDEELVEELSARDQVLCIVNNRRHARSLYESMSSYPGARHLTTLMCAKHRSAALEEIRELLRNGESCRLVSTSLIEAGVDVDFPAVFRAETGLDSIAQAAGRCNREGLRDISESEVTVFSVGSDWGTPSELTQFAQAARAVFRQFPDTPLSLSAIRQYFGEVYWQKGPKHLDAHGLMGLIEDGQVEGIPYEVLANKFRMIESNMFPIIIPFDDTAKRALESLKYAEKCGGLARALQPYIVQVPERGYAELRKAGAIQSVKPEKFGEQFMELISPSLYDERFGLNWDNPFFIQAEKTVI